MKLWKKIRRVRKPLEMRDKDVRKPRVTVMGESYLTIELAAQEWAKRRGVHWYVKPDLEIAQGFLASGTAVSKHIVLLPQDWSKRSIADRARLRWHELEHCARYRWGFRAKYFRDERFRLSCEVAAYAVSLIVMKRAGTTKTAVSFAALKISRGLHGRLKLIRIRRSECEQWSYDTMMDIVNEHQK